METRQIRNLILLALFVVLLSGSSALAGFIIEYQWWQELGQFDTWISILLYRIVPAAAASALCWLALLWAHSRGARFSGAPTGTWPLYKRLVAAGLLVISVVFVGSAVDSWAVMAYVGSLSVAAPADVWLDPVFDKELAFYLFRLPFYRLLLRFLFSTALFSIVIFWATGRGWQLFERLQRFREDGGKMEEFDPGPNPLLLEGATQTSFARILGSVGLIAGAVWFFLGQYTLLLNRHGFMTGMDYVDETFTLPLRWLVVASLLGAIPLLWTRNLRTAIGIVVGSLIANAALPTAVQSLYVRPNELSLEKPYIERHLEATFEAYDLNRGVERPFAATAEETLDINEHATLIDNIRLWDTKAFTDTITQIQALRPYYRFAVDIDRYTIDGKIKQVLLSPREIEIRQLPQAARDSWINTHLFYTHGYGVVAAEVNRTTSDGLPVLLIQDAPPQVRAPELAIEQAEIYYGEVTHDPVFVGTDQKEFDYPSGDQNITSSYAGDGGFPIDSLLLRLAAAVTEADYNILLTQLTNSSSRMMIHRNVEERLDHLAGFIEWDADPYLTISDDGRLIWIVDGYTTSAAHPYSESVGLQGRGINYIRNSVKATVDAYDGKTTLYIFDEEDPIVQAYSALFPSLFTSQDQMPPSVREHVRYPLLMFRIQAEIYRIFHMRNPEVFYNKEDEWNIARSLSGDSGAAEEMQPTYIVATLPGETEPEFLLMLPFTPRGKDNLIGWMAARCDGEHLGELVYFQLSKQQLVFGPNQIESRINQDQEIAKDLTLWNQQGSRVLRGDMLALPVGDAFLYVESIYIQAETARMPQLKKVVLAMGNRLIYEDTFEQALDRLSNGQSRTPEAASEESPTGEAEASSPTLSQAAEQQLRSVRSRLVDVRRQAQGLVDEIESIERELPR